LRNTMRFMLGSLSDFTENDRVEIDAMPELERWVLHRLAELDKTVREGYAAYDFQGVFQALFQFATVDLSSFYFDIRKDILYCDGDTPERKASRSVLDIVYHRLTTWLAPILTFTMEEVWLERHPGKENSVHLIDMAETPYSWLNKDLALKWATLRRVRRVVTGALEVERREKNIGSSLEASPIVYVDEATAAVLQSVTFSDLCITSGVEVLTSKGPGHAFSLEDTDGIAVEFAKADGEKCGRCWKILPDVGTHVHVGVCSRCDIALS
jgi:isoleucyl-tRNA synthetase